MHPRHTEAGDRNVLLVVDLVSGRPGIVNLDLEVIGGLALVGLVLLIGLTVHYAATR